MGRPTLRGAPDRLDAEIAARLGLRLSGHREIRSRTLQEIADEVGCTKSTLSKIESGNALPSLVTLMRLASSYGTTAGALLDP